MEIISNTLLLFNFIGNIDKSKEVLQALAQNTNKNVGAGLNMLESGLNNGKFEETLDLMKSGEIDIDINQVENYYQFNLQRLKQEVAQLAKKFDLESEIAITLHQTGLVVEGRSDNTKALQQYRDKDIQFSALVQQTAKLSQFVEWGQAKDVAAQYQAAQYQAEDMPEEQLVGFLKDARLIMSQVNQFIMSDLGSTFYSKGHTQQLIDNN